MVTEFKDTIDVNGGTRHLLSRTEVAELFAVTPNTVSRWARAGKLPYVLTLGGQHRYPRANVEVLLQERSFKP